MGPDIEDAMQTPDGSWRVEIARHGRTRWYRLVHDGHVTDRLSIGGVERILAAAGVDRGTLVPCQPA